MHARAPCCCCACVHQGDTPPYLQPSVFLLPCAGWVLGPWGQLQYLAVVAAVLAALYQLLGAPRRRRRRATWQFCCWLQPAG